MYVLIYFGGTGVELRASYMLGRLSTTCDTLFPPALLLSLVIFQVKSHIFHGLAWMVILLSRITSVGLPCPAYYLRWGLTDFLPGLALYWNSLNFCLLSNWDYRREPLCLALVFILFIYLFIFLWYLCMIAKLSTTELVPNLQGCYYYPHLAHVRTERLRNLLKVT
jgi:hypothetical protein